MKLAKQRISDMRRTNENLDEQLTETALERQALEHKVQQMKQESIRDNAKVEADLKSELDQRKLELEQLQE